MTPVSFLIVEDHPIFRQALLSMLHDAFPTSEFQTSGTLSEGKKIVEESKAPPIVILDINLPDSQGTDGARELLKVAPGLKVIALSADDSAERQTRLLKLGVHGFLSKTLSPDVFIQRLNALIVDRPVGAQARSKRWPTTPASPLSAKQRMVMVEMARGRSNKEIAQSIGIGVETVKSHVSEIIRRLNVRNRAEAISAFLAQEA